MSSLTKIDSSYYLQNQETNNTPNSALGKDEFLKILMTQLQNQDPLDPMDDRDFISQMATFSSLEQMMQMTSSIDSLVQNQMISPVVQYSHMIGKEVTYPQFDEDTGKEIGEKTSVVVAVTQEEGWAILKLDNGEMVYADAISQISEPISSDDEVTDPKGSE